MRKNIAIKLSRQLDGNVKSGIRVTVNKTFDFRTYARGQLWKVFKVVFPEKQRFFSISHDLSGRIHPSWSCSLDVGRKKSKTWAIGQLGISPR